MKRFVYADNSATTCLDNKAFEKMKTYMLTEYGNASQPYSFSRKSKAGLQEAREIIASCINASPDEIYFTSGGTESDNWAIKGTMLLPDSKNKLITSQIEHHAVLNCVEFLESQGYSATYLSATSDCVIKPIQLESAISEEVQLVSIMFANNEVGTIQPIQELSKVAHSYGAVFHTDAVQAIGHIPIDVRALDIDLLSASAHKFNGPKGIGFLYIKEGIKIEPLMHGGGQENSLRAGTENVAAILGMAYALRENCVRIEENMNFLNKLIEYFSQELNQIDGVDFCINGGTNTLPGVVSISFKDFDGEAILHRLDLRGITVSTGSACDGNNKNVSHVLSAMGLDESYAKGTIRISLGRDNTKEDVDYIVNEIKKIVCTRRM